MTPSSNRLAASKDLADLWPAHSELTIVVPIHGQLAVTRQFLETWERQTRSCSLLFVDDRSPDDSVAWLRDHGYMVHAPDQRLWFNGIVNLAARCCRTPLLGILNNDLLLGRRFVELTLDGFQRSGFDVLVPHTLLSTDPAVLDALCPYRIVRIHQQEGWCMLFRTASLRAIEPIPDELRLLFGDTWLFHHAWAQKQKVGIMLHNQIHHFGHSTRESGTTRKKLLPVEARDLELKRTTYAWLHGRRPGLHRLIPRKLRRILMPYYRPTLNFSYR